MVGFLGEGPSRGMGRFGYAELGRQDLQDGALSAAPCGLGYSPQNMTVWKESALPLENYGLLTWYGRYGFVNRSAILHSSGHLNAVYELVFLELQDAQWKAL